MNLDFYEIPLPFLALELGWHFSETGSTNQTNRLRFPAKNLTVVWKFWHLKVIHLQVLVLEPIVDFLAAVPTIELDFISSNVDQIKTWKHWQKVWVSRLQNIVQLLKQIGLNSDVEVFEGDLVTWLVGFRIPQTPPRHRDSRRLMQRASFPSPVISPNCQPLPLWAGVSNSGTIRIPLTLA